MFVGSNACMGIQNLPENLTGVQISKTFTEASVFAEFLLKLACSSFTALMDLPELGEFSDWSAKRLR